MSTKQSTHEIEPPIGVLTDFQIRLLRDALDRRYRRGASMRITTNVERPQGAEDIRRQKPREQPPGVVEVLDSVEPDSDTYRFDK